MRATIARLDARDKSVRRRVKNYIYITLYYIWRRNIALLLFSAVYKGVFVRICLSLSKSRRYVSFGATIDYKKLYKTAQAEDG
jgi:hypothetical protein